MRTGHGYDAHRLVEGRPLILGGVDIPFEKGLDGNSDADVLTHAVMNSLLGAAGMGDIGVHFPADDETFTGSDSLELLAKVVELVLNDGWRVENIDCTVVAQKPKLAPHVPRMRANLAVTLNIHQTRVSVKATTTEGMGFTGRGEGMEAHAVALLVRSPIG